MTKLIEKIDAYLNEAAKPAPGEEVVFVEKEPEGYFVYGNHEQAINKNHKHALSPKKSLGQALFAANDEQDYKFYRMMDYSLTPPYTEIKRIPAKYLDADKYMVD